MALTPDWCRPSDSSPLLKQVVIQATAQGSVLTSTTLERDR